MSGIVSRLSVLGKVWLGLAAGAMALIIFCLAASGSSLFFPLVSLWCNAALFALALLVLRRAGVELDLFHKAVLVGLWAAAVLYFYWTLGSRTFLYHWDYVNYILKQYHAEAAFAQSTGAGFRFLLDSITEDYTNFITLFTEFPFCLSGKTGDDYAFCQVFSVLPSLLVLLAGLTVKVGRMLRVKNRFWYFLIGFSWCATFPFVRMSAVLGQPDWFGLIFAFMLMLLLQQEKILKDDVLCRCPQILSVPNFQFLNVSIYVGGNDSAVITKAGNVTADGESHRAVMRKRLIHGGLFRNVAGYEHITVRDRRQAIHTDAHHIGIFAVLLFEGSYVFLAGAGAVPA